jgi:hypothetical protein
LYESGNVSANEKPDGPGPWILFPEIIGISIIGILLPLPLVHLLLAGHAFLAASGLLVWLVAVFFTVKFIRRPNYGFAYLLMGVIAGLFLILYKLCQ